MAGWRNGADYPWPMLKLSWEERRTSAESSRTQGGRCWDHKLRYLHGFFYGSYECLYWLTFFFFPSFSSWRCGYTTMKTKIYIFIFSKSSSFLQDSFSSVLFIFVNQRKQEADHYSRPLASLQNLFIYIRRCRGRAALLQGFLKMKEKKKKKKQNKMPLTMRQHWNVLWTGR